MSARELPLAGLVVLDLGHALAGPFAATMLGDFGADVLKVERPRTGDAMRNLGPRKHGQPIWWKAAARNKKSITLDFTTLGGRDVLLDLVRASDVLIENFRPGTLERYGLGWENLREVNPQLVMLQVSGFGQTGPDRGRPGFGRIAEAMSGAAELTGSPDGPPVHAGYSLADTLAGLMGAFGILVCLAERSRTGIGNCVDLALYEPLFRLIDWQAIVYDQLGKIPTRAGNQFPSVLEGVAAGVACTANGVWMSYSAATDSVLERMIQIVYGDNALRDARFATPEARRRAIAEIQGAVEQWISAHEDADVEEAFVASDAVIGRVFDIARIWSDQGYRERENLVRVADNQFGEITMHGVIPHLKNNPGIVRNTGPALGEHTDEILEGFLGLSSERITELRTQGVI